MDEVKTDGKGGYQPGHSPLDVAVKDITARAEAIASPDWAGAVEGIQHGKSMDDLLAWVREGFNLPGDLDGKLGVAFSDLARVIRRMAHEQKMIIGLLDQNTKIAVRMIKVWNIAKEISMEPRLEVRDPALESKLKRLNKAIKRPNEESETASGIVLPGDARA